MGVGISLAALRPDYARLWATARIRPECLRSCGRDAALIAANRSRYEAPAAAVGCPWWLCGIYHVMEAAGRWDVHPHNGDDPLTGRTKHAPAGRPLKGKPPFSWEESMVDALICEGFDEWPAAIWSSVEGCLYAIEIYNGMGYRKFHPQTKSPYLWSSTNHYGEPPSIGKYASDGRWDGLLISRQNGAAAIMLAGRFLG